MTTSVAITILPNMGPSHPSSLSAAALVSHLVNLEGVDEEEIEAMRRAVAAREQWGEP